MHLANHKGKWWVELVGFGSMNVAIGSWMTLHKWNNCWTIEVHLRLIKWNVMLTITRWKVWPP